MRKHVLCWLVTLAALPLGLPRTALAQDGGVPDPKTIEQVYKKPGYSPYAGRNFPTRVLWGDTHLHTSVSLDAAAVGCTTGPETAYRFARGEEIVTSLGQSAKLARPLDFLVVSDHAEAFGSMPEVIKGNPELMRDPQVKRWHDMILEGGESAWQAMMEFVGPGGAISDGSKMPDVMESSEFIRTIWEPYVQTAERFNEPGKFTAFIGYEWTSMPDGDNLHRVVVFRDGADKAIRTLPLSALESADPENLWKVLSAYEQETGGRVLAIPHNGNVSGGRMFALVDFVGNPLTRKYAEERARWEPLVEVTQQKGDGEAHPFLSPTDEMTAGYERWDKMNLGGTRLHEDSWFQTEYARSALKNGLELEQELGANPFNFGKMTNYEPSPHRIEHPALKLGDEVVLGGDLSASGYAAVWATENTREAIWDAMKRKEVYATTGSRIVVRFFGGWDFGAQDAVTRNPAVVGYTKGVAMGGDLRAAPAGKAPTFLVAAAKDPIGANLDRIQIVKGWLDAQGEVQERVYDVAWGDADKRKPGKDGKLPAVGNTVDVNGAIWTNTIGDPELIAVWKDPSFDPKQRAFYYTRVIEIPTPRWTAYDALRLGAHIPEGIAMTTTERAYTSPIWYTP
jgi:hypothetical protein